MEYLSHIIKSPRLQPETIKNAIFSLTNIHTTNISTDFHDIRARNDIGDYRLRPNEKAMMYNATQQIHHRILDQSTF